MPLYIFIHVIAIVEFCSADVTDIIIHDPSKLEIFWTIEIPPYATLALTLPDSATLLNITDADGELKYLKNNNKISVTASANPEIRVRYMSSFEKKAYLSYSAKFPTELVRIWVPSHMTLIYLKESYNLRVSNSWKIYTVNNSNITFTVALNKANYILSQRITVEGDKTRDLTLHILLASSTDTQTVKETIFYPIGKVVEKNGYLYGEFKIDKLKGKRILEVTQKITAYTTKKSLGISPDNALNLTGYWEMTTDMEKKAEELGSPDLIFDWIGEYMTYAITDKRMGAIYAYQTGKGDCNEYSDLYIAMCRYLSLPTVLIEGITLGSGHAWAAIYRGGRWQTMDPLWDIFGFTPSSHVLLSYSKDDRGVSNLKISFYGDRPAITHSMDLKIEFQEYKIDKIILPALKSSNTTEIFDNENILIKNNRTDSIKELFTKGIIFSDEQEKLPPGQNEGFIPEKIDAQKYIGRDYFKKEFEIDIDYRGSEIDIQQIPIEITETELAAATGILILLLIIVIYTITKG